jgi:hypothetical protein
MGNVHGSGQQPRKFDDDDQDDKTSRRPRVDPGERDEYDEWRRERGSRGRKRKDKAGGRHRLRRDDDLDLDS